MHLSKCKCQRVYNVSLHIEALEEGKNQLFSVYHKEDNVVFKINIKMHESNWGLYQPMLHRYSHGQKKKLHFSI